MLTIISSIAILVSIISGILDSFDPKFLYKEIFTIHKTIKWILQIVRINVYLLKQKIGKWDKLWATKNINTILP